MQISELNINEIEMVNGGAGSVESYFDPVTGQERFFFSPCATTGPNTVPDRPKVPSQPAM
ncbi:hypothetical protein [Kordiimonas sp. SCSIO 12610]|uniref:hypothetical protein n=1 Tax=Kordiimonas sp. SCSIO 12610 TaxID=2829597 RepID=UPI00210ACDA1|nr:hypothetical protein [Kordiimonas sp. SCSIO 12610]UTW54523.1 hypothetical protein KFF44_12005 [Kordiimonas sp. SCSIO 12610]